MSTNQLQPGTLLDERYEIIRVIGGGGMGTVYAATEKELQRVVAIKVINPSSLSDAINLARFEREGKILSLLNHRNIAMIYRFAVDKNVP